MTLDSREKNTPLRLCLLERDRLIHFGRTAFLTVLIVTLAGCGSLGPGSITRDRFDYAGAISDSWKSQMLMNVVKLRYSEPPVFLDWETDAVSETASVWMSRTNISCLRH